MNWVPSTYEEVAWNITEFSTRDDWRRSRRGNWSAGQKPPIENPPLLPGATTASRL